MCDEARSCALAKLVPQFFVARASRRHQSEARTSQVRRKPKGVLPKALDALPAENVARQVLSAPHFPVRATRRGDSSAVAATHAARRPS